MLHPPDRFALHSAKEHIAEITIMIILAMFLIVIAYVDLWVFLVSLGVLAVLPIVSKIFGNSD